MKKLLFLLAGCIMTSGSMWGVTFKVQVPEGTRNCYVCGDFNGWDVDNAPQLTSTGDNMFTLDMPEVASVSGGYKYLCGRSWDYVEKDANGGEIDNRTAIGDPDVVGSWRGVPEYGIESFELTVNGVPRLIKVYLPEGYAESNATYPVMYYNTVQQRYSKSGDDGNPGDYFFGANSWNAQTTMEKLSSETGKKYIMVQICSFMGENTPGAHDDYKGTGYASQYLNEFITKLIPEVNSKWRVDGTQPSVIVGADYGALFSIYAVLSHPEIFGTCVAMSPMLWINSTVMKEMASSAEKGQNFYISVGSKEPEWMKTQAGEIADLLTSAGANAYFTEFDGGVHNDGSWGLSFPTILKAVSTSTAPETGNKDEEDEGDKFADSVFSMYSARNETGWSTAFKGLFTYTDEFYLSDSTTPVEAFVFTQTLGSTYTSNYYWNVAKGPDNTFGWMFSSPKTIGFNSNHKTDSWQRVAVLADGTVKDMNAMYNMFKVYAASGNVTMTSTSDYKASATVAFNGTDKKFNIHYGSVNSGSDQGALTADYYVRENCTEAKIEYDFALNKVTVTETKTDGTGQEVTPPDFKDNVFTLYASDVQTSLAKVGTFTYTDEYYKKGSSEPVSAMVITYDVPENYKSKYYWNIAKGATDADGWLMGSPKEIGFSSSRKTVAWLNVAVYEDGTIDNIAADSKGFRVVNGSNNTVMMTQTSAHVSKATVPFTTSDKTFTVHFGSVNSSSDQGAVTPTVSVSQNCLEAEITYDFNLNKVSVVETKFGDISSRPAVKTMQAYPAVCQAGQDISVKFTLNKSATPAVSAKYNNATLSGVVPVKDSDTEYHINLAGAKEGIYTFTVNLSDATGTVNNAATINVRVVSGDASKSKILTVNAYKDINWETVNRYKANFHTHTSQSFDTQYATSTVVDRYKDAGYKILALTDHDANSYPWSMFDLYNAEAEARNPQEMGMLAIPGNELSKDRRNNWSESTGGEFNHHNDLFTGRHGQEFMSLRESYAYTEALGGMQIINHPGQYWKLSTEYKSGEKNSPEWHAENFTRYSSLIGLEVYNQGDRRSDDRILWDQILTMTMPNRPVWGYSCDDTHSLDQYFRNYQFMLMDGLNVDDLKTAMQNGSTVFSYEYTGSGEAKAPRINAITVDEDAKTITVDTDNADDIEWIYSTHRTGSSASTAQSTVIGKGNTFDYNGYAGSYVRARLVNAYGETATQPFGFDVLPVTSVESPVADRQDALTLVNDRMAKQVALTCTEPMERITVLNAAGQIVKYFELQNLTAFEFSTADLAPGVYVVVAATPKSAYTAKF